MTFEQVQNQVLKLLNQYSVAGTIVAPAYNNQQDYLNRMASLANDAVMEIATTARKIPAALSLDALYGEDAGDYLRYELPEDFYQFKTGDTLLTTDEGRLLHTNCYTVSGRRYLLVPKREIEEGASYTITYYRYPKLLGEKPDATDELDNEPETHFAVPFYVAAFLVIHDDSFLFSAFYNKFEDKLAKMSAGLSVEARAVDDVYDFGAGE
nr:MAG TPA_asm: hypothetical protein [Caudoviricetes sp.]